MALAMRSAMQHDIKYARADACSCCIITLLCTMGTMPHPANATNISGRMRAHLSRDEQTACNASVYDEPLERKHVETIWPKVTIYHYQYTDKI